MFFFLPRSAVSFFAYGLAALFFLTAAHPASALSAGEGFDSANALSDEELSGLRGGFITANGIQIDFALSTRTVIDGVTQADFIINSANLDKVNADNLRQVIQVGEKNTNDALNTLVQNPALLTVIQNSKDNTVIQNFSVLDISARNLAAYQQQGITPSLDYQTVIAAVR